MINESNYLVPQMTRDQKRMAIEGPIAVGGGEDLESFAEKELLADLGDNQDQLPILQHAMMRTWDYWIANREPGEPIDIRHYNAVGKISQALSLHANEAFDELTSREKEIAEVLFKNLTEKNVDNQGLRRPCTGETHLRTRGSERSGSDQGYRRIPEARTFVPHARYSCVAQRELHRGGIARKLDAYLDAPYRVGGGRVRVGTDVQAHLRSCSHVPDR